MLQSNVTPPTADTYNDTDAGHVPVSSQVTHIYILGILPLHHHLSIFTVRLPAVPNSGILSSSIINSHGGGFLSTKPVLVFSHGHLQKTTEATENENENENVIVGSTSMRIILSISIGRSSTDIY